MSEAKKSIKNLSPREQVATILKGVDMILQKASAKNQNKEDLQKASQYLIRCIQIDPKCIDAYLQLANIFKHNKNYDEAIGLLLNVLALDKNNKMAKDLLIDMKNHIIEKIKISSNNDLKSKLGEIEKELNSQIGSVNAFSFNK